MVHYLTYFVTFCGVFLLMRIKQMPGPPYKVVFDYLRYWGCGFKWMGSCLTDFMG